MIEHVYHRSSGATRTHSVLVATDDSRVADAVTAFGGHVRMTSPTHRNGTERLAEVAGDLTSDLVVNVQGDEPLIAPEMIDLAVSAFDRHPGLLMSTLRAPITDDDEMFDPHVVKVVTDRAGYALYFSRCALPYGTTSGSRARFKHVGLYVYRREFLIRLAALEPTPLERAERLEQLRALEHGFRIMTIETTHGSIGVDTPEDLDRVRRLLSPGVG